MLPYCHIDADSFFASVLVRQDPRLIGKPLLALGMGGGCVISASYEAKAKGVKTGMRLSEARKLIPGVIAINSDFAETGIASEDIEAILREDCPSIEQMSVDEWFLDLTTLVGGSPKDPVSWGKERRKEVLSRTGLSVSVGIAPTKLLSKMASEYRKPAGVTVVDAASDIDLKAFLSDRPAAAIPGLGHRRMHHSDVLGWKTAWDVTQSKKEDLVRVFGRPGLEMQKELLGFPVNSIVTDPPPPKSLSRARSFSPVNSREILWAHMLRHLEYLMLKMRRHGLMASGISLWLRDRTYTHYSGEGKKLGTPSNTEQALLPVISRVFSKLYQPGQSYTQTGLVLFNLTPEAPSQLSLLEEPAESAKHESLQESLDMLHEKFGRNAISRGAAMPVKSGTKRRMELSVFE